MRVAILKEKKVKELGEAYGELNGRYDPLSPVKHSMSLNTFLKSRHGDSGSPIHARRQRES